MFCYNRVPHIDLQTSYGVKYGSSTCFILQYRVYRTPRGLARFPDGGQVRELFCGYYCMVMGQDTLRVVRELDLGAWYRIRFFFTELAIGDREIYLTVAFYRKGSLEMERETLKYPMEEGEPVTVKTDPPVTPGKDRVSKSALRESLDQLLFYRETGLPDPAPLVSFGRRRDLKTLMGPEANRYTRRALAGNYLGKRDKAWLEKASLTPDRELGERLATLMKKMD